MKSPGKTTLVPRIVYLENEFIKTSRSRLTNDAVAGAKKHIERNINVGGSAFIVDEACQLASKHDYGGASVP